MHDDTHLRYSPSDTVRAVPACRGEGACDYSAAAFFRAAVAPTSLRPAISSAE